MRLPFLCINSPIFSNVASPICHGRGFFTVSFMLCSNLFIYAQSGDFPLPVGMHTHSQRMTGSFQSVPFTCTTDGDSKNPVIPIKEDRTAVEDMLKAFPT